MAQREHVNVAAFAADYLGRVGRVFFRGISVGSMITQIIEHIGYGHVLLEETPVVGKNKVGMAALILKGMIEIHRDYYSLVIHKRLLCMTRIKLSFLMVLIGCMRMLSQKKGRPQC